jgi:aquaporin NIP
MTRPSPRGKGEVQLDRNPSTDTSELKLDCDDALTTETLAPQKDSEPAASAISLGRQCLAEGLGTALLVFFGCGAVSSNGASAGLFGIAFAWGAIVYVLIEAVGDISGAHFNPAVTLTLFLVAGVPWYKVPIYWISQFAGAFVGGAVLAGLTPDDADANVGKYNSGIAINEAVSPAQAFGWEFMGTLGLVLAVLLIAVRPGQHLIHPGFPIGLTVCFCVVAAGPFTGAGINPARVVGAVAFEDGFWDSKAGAHFYVYLLGPFLASIVGPMVAWLLYPADRHGMVMPSVCTSIKRRSLIKQKYKDSKAQRRESL